MHFDELSSATCPRCTAPIAIASAGCGRCGLAFEPTPDGRYVQASGPLCPRCDRVDVPGAQFAGVTGRSEHGSCGNCGTPLVLPEAMRSSAYEERAVSAAAVDLERLARVESVDGWQLLDTTVDPAAPERIIAHFRRGLQARPARSSEGDRRRRSRRAAGDASNSRRRMARPTAANRPPAENRQDPDAARARKAVEALETEARSALGRNPSPRPAVKPSRREVAAAARRARVEAKAERRQNRDSRRRQQLEAREARRQARFARRMARIGKGRQPASRHVRGALKGGNMAAVGLVSLVVHMLVLGGFVIFRYLVLPILMLALVVARAVFEALVDELVHRPRRRAAFRRRHHARWV